VARTPHPIPDEVSQDWWNATIDRRLMIQQCMTCCHRQHYPRPFCLSCAGEQLELVKASGNGTIHSFTVIQRSAYEELPAPYVIALVDLEEGVRLLTRIVDSDSNKLSCDMAVVLQWTKAPGDNPYHLPVFALGNEREGTCA
jgi:uncharacterized OB-fold protein